MRRHESSLPNRANLTPLIDVVFLLIIFFMLVAQITRQRVVDLELPSIEDSVASDIDAERRAVVNVVPEALVDRYGGDYRLGSNAYGRGEAGLARLAADLRARAERAPDTSVLLRASRDEAYERVFPALRAAAMADIASVELVVIEEGAP
jgi:biopolymer transport protein ExbD